MAINSRPLVSAFLHQNHHFYHEISKGSKGGSSTSRIKSICIVQIVNEYGQSRLPIRLCMAQPAAALGIFRTGEEGGILGEMCILDKAQ